MPAPRWLARINSHFTNRIAMKIARTMPGMAIVHHAGRHSGRVYRTPVLAFRDDTGFIIALVYGSESDWVKNVFDAGSCDLETRGHDLHATNPQIRTDPKNRWAPLPIRLVLNQIEVPKHLHLTLE